MPFQAVASQRLFQQVADQIAGLIRSGELPPGTRLPAERDLAKKLGVSRPIVREAMIALELSGLVEVRTGAGSYVCEKPARPGEMRDVGPSVLELLSARRVIEGEVAAHAAKVAKPEDIARLDEALAWYSGEYLKGEDCFEADRAFHIGLAEATGNAVFVHIVEQFWGDMRGPIFNRLGELTKHNAKIRTNIADHESIRNAVVQHDEDGARRAMHLHIANVESYFFDDSKKPNETRRKIEKALK